MSFLADPALHKKFVDALNANTAFASQALAFDGAVQFEVDGDCLWLKIYKGRVIDHQASHAPAGHRPLPDVRRAGRHCKYGW